MNRSPILVYCPSNVGGVRQVTESLATGIEQNERTVVRAHGLLDVLRARLLDGVTCGILSLEAGYLSCLFSNSIYILHGFPFVGAHSALRRVLIRMAARLAKLGGAKLVAVSHLTRAVHERVYGIKIDAVIFNGCSDSLNDYASQPHDHMVPKQNYVTYVGRLIDVKGVRAILAGFLKSRLPAQGYKLKVAGTGPLGEWVKKKSAEHPEIEALGEISEDAKERLLFQSEAFVSLNDLEPMGVVFVEAVLAGCKIVAPFCGGHREFIPIEHPISLCDPASIQSVANALDRVPYLGTERVNRVGRLFSYRDHIAPLYLTILDGGRAVVQKEYIGKQ